MTTSSAVNEQHVRTMKQIKTHRQGGSGIIDAHQCTEESVMGTVPGSQHFVIRNISKYRTSYGNTSTRVQLKQ